MRKGTNVILVAVLVALSAGMVGANSISVNGTAADTGLYGLEVNYDGAASLAYVQSSSTGAVPHPWSDETGIEFEFTIDPGGQLNNPGQMVMGLPGNVRITNLFEGFITNGVHVVLFLKRGTDVDTWRFAAYVREDGTGFKFAGEGYLTGLQAYTATRVVVEWKAASAPGANDGYIKATRTLLGGAGFPTYTIFDKQNLNNDTHVLNILRLGSPSTNEVGNPAGSYYIDDVVISRIQ